MEPQTSTPSRRRRSKGAGRQDKSGQETVKNITKLNDDMQKLLTAYNNLEAAKTDFSELVKKSAEKSGFMASVVRKLVAAKAGDDFDEVKRVVDQMSEAFELAG